MTTSNKSVYTIALIHPKWVRVYASEMDLGYINMGAAAQVIRDSQPNQPITGKIGYISSVAEFTPKRYRPKIFARLWFMKSEFMSMTRMTS